MAKKNILTILRENKRLGKQVRIIICLRIDRPIRYVYNLPGFKEVITLAESVSYNYYFDNWSGRIRGGDLTGNMRLRPKTMLFLKNINPCSLLYDRVAILPNGDIALCGCRELNGDSELVIGNIESSSLQEQYDSERVRAIRRRWLSKKIIPDICRDCTNYSPRQFLMFSENRHLFKTVAVKKNA
jgi:radical SAM protein with 4Fe4S-binding SPASM domain